MDKNDTILIVGHNDVIDRSLLAYLTSNGCKKVFSSSPIGLDTTIQSSVYDFFAKERPIYVFLSSVKSGGIKANIDCPADFIYHNCESQNNVIYAANKFGTKKLLYFMGSCAYPKESPQPIKEEYLLTGALEPTNEAYAVAKIAGAKLCQAYRRQYGFNAIVASPATVYGPLSDIGPQTAHVIGALIGKFYKAKKENDSKVTVWGSGKPRREFLYADDFAEAILLLMEHYSGEEIINIGCGQDISIKDLAFLIKDIVGFKGDVLFDSSKPDGMMNKLMDNSRIKKLGWKPKITLEEGIQRTYQLIKEKEDGRQ